MIKSEQYNYIKPSHYEIWEGCEVFDILKKTLTKEEYIGFCKGNILKYQLRLGRKPNEPIERDKKKIEEYEKITPMPMTPEQKNMQDQVVNPGIVEERITKNKNV